ncbi:MBL fold metallo-hydrolase [Planococcus sp. ISL-110]|uniref:MBL fold metallo-hydrolase n=1 Tax=Planococcus sp. ISL-110 TaxID=2819167 RepID=UPI001BE579D6|nr:MBL fold metallo-hydrolase [Planococcus sp. ISL-110]MBT2571499.1 MBL fold metallo-hydrolase [Planococcus sp. ISL-110]
MLLKYFYDSNLAQASYMVGCQQSNEAVIIDPARDIAPYVEAAKKEGMKIIGSFETHIHADFVTGSRELASQEGAKMYLSDEGSADWKYENLEHIPHQLVKDGDQIKVGNLTFTVLHTPGHTPESISFTLIDGGIPAEEPMGIFTGDFVFVGDVGRPDLLEKAAKMEGTSAEGAKQMFESLKKFKQLPDYLQLWPGHGAGSACGKALGAVPSSTIGYEKKYNWALQFEDENEFSKELLDGQPEPPTYFAVMKHVNKVGPTLVKELEPVKEVKSLSEIERLVEKGVQVIDTRSATQFSEKYIPGTVNIPLNSSFTNWAGWLVDYKRPLSIITASTDIEGVEKALHSVGIDQLSSCMNAQLIEESEGDFGSYPSIKPMEAKQLFDNNKVNIIDVRNSSEWNEGHIEGAHHILLGTLKEHLDDIPTDKPVLVQCGSGVRSTIGVSVLKSNGFDEVLNLTGGYSQWRNEIEK